MFEKKVEEEEDEDVEQLRNSFKISTATIDRKKEGNESLKVLSKRE